MQTNSVSRVGSRSSKKGSETKGIVMQIGQKYTRWMDPVTARRVPSKLRRVEQGSKRGNQQGEKIARGMYRIHMNLFSPRVYIRMFVVIE
jgi:arginine exporter protein ArgO